MSGKTIIISSTGLDLKDYRQAAIETCLKLELFPLAMEHFEVMGLGATEGSKLKLDRADGYVGIFAHRYGYIEQGHDKSVTEIEFEYAGERGLERLCFLVDPKYPWSPEAWDYKNYERLQQFKSHLSETVLRGLFTTLDDFKAKLMPALVEWKERHGYGRAMSTPGEVDVKTAAAAPPHPALVIGREGDVSKLKARFGIVGNLPKEPVTVIRGWPGVGKTTLVNALAYDPEVGSAFPDGVLWTAVGEAPNPLGELTAWARALGARETLEAHNLEEVIGRVRALLRDKKMFLIVDDVWAPRRPHRSRSPDRTAPPCSRRVLAMWRAS